MESVGKEAYTSGVNNFIGERLFFKWQARGMNSYSVFVQLYDQVSLLLLQLYHDSLNACLLLF